MFFFRFLFLILFTLTTCETLQAQLRVTAGTNLHVSPGTKVIIDLPGALFIADSLSIVVNDGDIVLGDSTNVQEHINHSITGSGIECTSRSLSSLIECTNVAGLGITLQTNGLPGVTTVTRGHTSLYPSSVSRWFSVTPVSLLSPDSVPVTLFYDPTELNSNQAAELHMLHTTNQFSGWKSLNGSSNVSAYSVSSVTDSTGWFTLISTVVSWGQFTDAVWCHTDSVHIGYVGNGYFNPDNIFIFELSDPTGSFSSLTLSDTLTLNPNTFHEYINTSIPAGNLYKARIHSTSPLAYTVDSTVHIHALPVPALTSLLPVYCINSAPDFTGAYPAGGFYNTPFILNDTVYPALAPVGLNYIEYSYIDIYGCTGYAYDTTEILAGPAVPVITVINDTLYSSSAANYQWYFNDSIILGATNIFYVPTADGNYTVTVSDSTCTSESASVFFDYTRIAEYSSSYAYVYPNPVTESTLFVQLPENAGQIKLVTLLNTDGKIHEPEWDSEKNSSQIKISLSRLDAAVYILRIITTRQTLNFKITLIR